MELTGKNPSKELIFYIRKRIISNAINLIAISILSLFIIGFILDYVDIRSVSGFYAFLLIVIGYFVSTYLLMCLLVKMTKGYSIGGLIFGLKVISIKEDIRSIKCLRRVLYSIMQILYFHYFIHVRFNTNGQFYYDEKFDTKVADRKHIFNEKNVEYFEYNFLKEFFLFFIFVFVVLAIIGFILNITIGSF